MKQDNEDRFYGLHACKMIFERRKEDIKKVYVNKELTSSLAQLLKYCAQKKIAYKVVNERALEQVCESVHHGGVCIYAKPKKILNQKEFFNTHEPPVSSTIVFLENVNNPHNIGATVRSMAHFGVKTLLHHSESPVSLKGANYRIAEGGYEFVDFVRIDNIDSGLSRLKKAGYIIYGTSVYADTKLYDSILPDKLVILMGNEATGLSKKALSYCDKAITIPGTGNVESLNVSVSLALFLGESYRQKISEKIFD